MNSLYVLDHVTMLHLATCELWEEFCKMCLWTLDDIRKHISALMVQFGENCLCVGAKNDGGYIVDLSLLVSCCWCCCWWCSYWSAVHAFPVLASWVPVGRLQSWENHANHNKIAENFIVTFGQTLILHPHFIYFSLPCTVFSFWPVFANFYLVCCIFPAR